MGQRAKVAGGFVADIVLGFLCVLGLDAIQSYESPSPGYAKALLNDCDGFTVMGADTRRAVSVTWIGDASAASGNNITVEFDWRWVSGEKAKDATLHHAGSSFLYSDKHEWIAVGVVTPLVKGDSGLNSSLFHCRGDK